jgi:hypothetical protein
MAKQKKVKWELAFWQLFDKQATELLKNPEDVEKKILSALAEIIHDEKMKEDK